MPLHEQQQEFSKFVSDFGGQEEYDRAKAAGTISSEWYAVQRSYHPPHPRAIPTDLNYRILVERVTSKSFLEPLILGAPSPTDLLDQSEAWAPPSGSQAGVPGPILEATILVLRAIPAIPRLLRQASLDGNRMVGSRLWVPQDTEPPAATLGDLPLTPPLRPYGDGPHRLPCLHRPMVRHP